MKYYSHLNTAVDILGLYKGDLPFHHFIKDYLKLNKKFGSKDRKSISRLCYSALRLGNAFNEWPLADKVRAGLFLCTNVADEATLQLLGDYNEIMQKPLPEKWRILSRVYLEEISSLRGTLPPGNVQALSSSDSSPGVPAGDHHTSLLSERLSNSEAVSVEGSDSNQVPSYGLEQIFPASLSSVSEGIDTDALLQAFFIQPELFIRMRPGHEDYIKDKLAAAGIPFVLLPPSAIRLPVNTRLDDLFLPDKEIVIQDYSSQRTGQLLPAKSGSLIKVWDACAASGGKSLLAKDYLDNIFLTVTDIRSSIIHNLSVRFRQAGLTKYRSYIADLSADTSLPFDDLQDLVVADVPCSGSGTWSRTPEQLSIFDPMMIGRFQQLQQSILRKVVTRIKPGGYLLFVTCSIFREENEQNIAFLVDALHLKLLNRELITGYQYKADTLFAALLQMPVENEEPE